MSARSKSKDESHAEEKTEISLFYVELYFNFQRSNRLKFVF